MRALRITVVMTVILLVLGLLLFPAQQALASVTLTDFYAEPGTTQIVLHWETVTEIDTLGFNVWRGTDCNPANSTRVNESLIPPQGDGATGASYSLADTDVQPGIVYDYRLEDLSTDGTPPNCHQEPEFQVSASLIGGPGISTPTRGGEPGSGPTSTPEPSDTPAPTNTPAPANTPAGQNQSPTVTQSAPPSPTANPATDDPARPTATMSFTGAGANNDDEGNSDPAGGGEDVVQDNQNTVDNGAAGETETDGNGAEPAGNDTVPGSATAEAIALRNDTETDDTQDLNTVGDSAAPLIGENFQDLETAENTAGSESRGMPITLIAVGLVGGLIVLFGGVAAVWFLVLNRQS